MKILQKSLNFLFKISTQPVNLRDLLEANALFNEGMLVDPSKLNFRLKTLNAYIFYSFLCAIFLIPLLLITHYFFTILDFHISILSTILTTACVFIGFDLFKIYARKKISQILIKKAWSVHFPCFTYEKYSKIVEEIYKQAIKNEIPKTALEQFVLEKIVQNHK